MRLARGIAMTDADRVHCFVMGELFKRQVVLLYRPHNRPGGFSLVLASPWSLERGKTDGRHFVTFDAKHDTQESGQLRWSSFRCTSSEDHGHVGVPISVQVADRENEETIKEFALATRGGIACSDPACAHGWGAPAEASDGTWRRERVCCRSLPLSAMLYMKSCAPCPRLCAMALHIADLSFLRAVSSIRLDSHP